MVNLWDNSMFGSCGGSFIDYIQNKIVGFQDITGFEDKAEKH